MPVITRRHPDAASPSGCRSSAAGRSASRSFHYGPFVMSAKSELIQAVEDCQAGKFGTVPPNALVPHTSGR